MNKDYCDILIQAIDTMIQGANEPQRMEYTKSDEKLELNEEQDSMLLVADPFVDMLQVEEYNGDEIKVDAATITLPLWSLINKNVNFDLLGIEGEFTTSPKENVEQIDGSYGVQLTVYGGNKIYTIQFDSSEMLGDINNFNHMLQKKVFDLTGVSGISYIGIKLYNNTNLNVIINNLHLLVGYNLTKVEDTGSPLQLYSESDSLVYKTDFADKVYEGEKQTLKVKYIYQEDGKYRAISHLNVDSLPATAQLLWYRYNPALPQSDMWGGPYWQNLVLSEKENLFSREFTLDGELEQEKFKVVLLNTDIAAGTVTPIYSNEIVFIREKAEAEEYISDLKMRLADGSGGGYPYYDFDQLLVTRHLHQSQIVREANVEFKTGYSNLDLLKQIKSVTWSWPIGIIEGRAKTIGGAILKQLESDGRALAVYSEFSENNEVQATSLLESLFKFNYQIPDFRNSINTDGNLECTIEFNDGIKYQAFNLISLAVAGASGTDYSVIARIVDAKGQMKRAVVPNKQFYLQVKVYDSKGEEIKKPAIRARHYWTGEIVSGSPLVLSTIGNINNSIPDAILLECVVETGLIIKEIVPIPVASDESYTYLGPSKVMYSSEGNKPEYEDAPIQLKENGMKAEEQVTGVTWTIDGDFIADNGESYGLAPKIYSNNYFQPVGVFDKIMTTQPIGIRGTIGGQTQWLQPVILYQNRYFSRVINGWDGALEINEEDGYILASSYVAGGKNEDNTFTGAILGELGTIEHGADSDAAPDPKRTGLFGYKEGVQTFGFKADGTGFIGVSGRGRINFDGINGAIYSGNFDGFNTWLDDEKTQPDLSVLPNEGTKGSYLDLTDGLFITSNGKFRGKIETKEGDIAGWQITNSGLMKNHNGVWTGISTQGEVFQVGSLLLTYFDENKNSYLVIGPSKISTLGIEIPGMINGLPVIGIADQAFVGHPAVRTLSIDIRIKQIGKRAFYNCSSDMLFLSSNISNMGEEAFNLIESKNIYFKESREEAEENIRDWPQNWCKALDNSKFIYEAIWDTEQNDWNSELMSLDSSMPRFFAGGKFDTITGLLDINNTRFLVQADGTLWANGANIRGRIESDELYVGGFGSYVSIVINNEDEFENYEFPIYYLNSGIYYREYKFNNEHKNNYYKQKDFSVLFSDSYSMIKSQNYKEGFTTDKFGIGSEYTTISTLTKKSVILNFAPSSQNGMSGIVQITYGNDSQSLNYTVYDSSNKITTAQLAKYEISNGSYCLLYKNGSFTFTDSSLSLWGEPIGRKKFTNQGSSLNLRNGIFVTPNFLINEIGQVYIKGRVEALEGYIGAGNVVWEIGGDDNRAYIRRGTETRATSVLPQPEIPSEIYIGTDGISCATFGSINYSTIITSNTFQVFGKSASQGGGSVVNYGGLYLYNINGEPIGSFSRSGSVSNLTLTNNIYIKENYSDIDSQAKVKITKTGIEFSSDAFFTGFKGIVGSEESANAVYCSTLYINKNHIDTYIKSQIDVDYIKYLNYGADYGSSDLAQYIRANAKVDEILSDIEQLSNRVTVLEGNK